MPRTTDTGTVTVTDSVFPGFPPFVLLINYARGGGDVDIKNSDSNDTVLPSSLFARLLFVSLLPLFLSFTRTDLLTPYVRNARYLRNLLGTGKGL